MSIPSHRRAILHAGNSVERHSHYYLLHGAIPRDTKLLMVALDLLPLKKSDHFALLDAMAQGGKDNTTLEKVGHIVNSPVILNKGQWSNISYIMGRSPKVIPHLRAQWIGDAMGELDLPHNKDLMLNSYDVSINIHPESSPSYYFVQRYTRDNKLMDAIIARHYGEEVATTPQGWELPRGIRPFLGDLLEWAPRSQLGHGVGVERGLLHLSKGHSLGEGRIHEAVEYLVKESPSTVKEIVDAGLAVDKKKVHSFLDLVQEYNVEWALASFEWSEEQR